ncbi:TonB-dependent receptor domain-containing protein [Aliivibrio sp. EL58]|uniref:TonB-dependent receptor domain-containing protein n=1 Tax=Aliivibrio sp. EL58 TaxID=2107582 RepID=UPI000EFCEFEB
MKKTALATAIVSLLSHAYTSPVFAQNTTTETDETMVVTANRFEQSDAAVLAQTVVLTKVEIEKLQPQSLIDVFKTLPSIEITQYGGRGQTASIFVRGGSSSQVLLLVDGVRMPKAAMGGVDFNQFPVNSVERIEYIRGARASIYGSEAISGVINIITQANKHDDSIKLHAGIGSNGHYSGSVAVSKPITEKGHLKAVVGYESVDGYNVKPMPGLNDDDEHGFESYNILLGYQHQFNENWSGLVSTVAYTNETEFDNSAYEYVDPIFGSPERHEMKINRVEFLGVNSKVNYSNEKFNSSLNANYSTQDSYDFIKGTDKNATKNVTTIDQVYLAWLSSYELAQGLTLGGGIDYRQDKLVEAYGYGSVPYQPEENPRSNLGVSALVQYQIEAWSLESSVRSDDNNQYGRHNTWQAAAGWNFFDDYELTASYGTAFRAPNFTDLYYPGSEVSNLEPETSKNTEISLQGYSYVFEWSITGYINEIDNMLMWYTDYGNVNYGYMQNIGKAEIKGIELALGFDTSIIHHQFYMDFKDPIDKSGTEETQLSHRSKKGMKWNTSIELDAWSFGTQYLYEGERFSGTTRLASYSLWNVVTSYAFSESFKVNGKVSNIFDEEYETNVGYVPPGREFFISADYQF